MYISNSTALPISHISSYAVPHSPLMKDTTHIFMWEQSFAIQLTMADYGYTKTSSLHGT